MIQSMIYWDIIKSIKKKFDDLTVTQLIQIGLQLYKNPGEHKTQF